MHRAHFALFAAAAFALSACNVGFDPRNLERLEYGMEQCRIAELLESDEPAIPLFRCFVVGEDGRSQDVCVVLHESLSPHPFYLSVSIDGRLAAVTILPPQEDNPWQPYRRRESAAIVAEWRPDELRALVRDALARRVDLQWSAIEPLDTQSSDRRAPRGATALEGTLFVIPLVLYLPYWAYMNTIGDEGRGRASGTGAAALRTGDDHASGTRRGIRRARLRPPLRTTRRHAPAARMDLLALHDHRGLPRRAPLVGRLRPLAQLGA